MESLQGKKELVKDVQAGTRIKSKLKKLLTQLDQSKLSFTPNNCSQIGMHSNGSLLSDARPARDPPHSSRQTKTEAAVRIQKQPDQVQGGNGSPVRQPGSQ
jgi:hypothetical protein